MQLPELLIWYLKSEKKVSTDYSFFFFLLKEFFRLNAIKPLFLKTYFLDIVLD